MNDLKICYVWDEDLIQQCDRLPAVLGRATLVHNLISAYGLLSKVQVIRSTSALYSDLKLFHSELYLDHLKKLTAIDDEYIPDAQDEEYGIVYDCPPVSHMYKLVSTIAGGSITAAKCLVLGVAEVAFNWCGGWHHAQRFGAEGFCYVNDIVIAIEKLRHKFPKVLYIDLDVHHGNGVQDAYNLSKSVFTLSFHKHEPGFYPGTGSVEDIGVLTGKGYSCNVPLKSGYSDTTLEYIFQKAFTKIYSIFMPDAIVVQCGADALAHDPHGGAGLTTLSYCKCIQSVLDKRKPTMLLGGGGYNHPNAARLWTTLLSLVAGVKLDENIPEHDQWPHYGPDYLLRVEPTLVKDANTVEYLDSCLSAIDLNLKSMEETSKEESLPKRQKTADVSSTRPTKPVVNAYTSYKVLCSENDQQKKGNVAKEITNIKTTNCIRIFEGTPLKHDTPPTLKHSKDVYEFVD